MGIFDRIPDKIYRAFQGKMRPATLYRRVPDASAGTDAKGYPNVVALQQWPCEGFTDLGNDDFRGPTPRNTTRISIFASSVAVPVQKDDVVGMAGAWYQLSNVKSDPANAMWVCDGLATREPT